jgi:hypothetical protein
MSRTFRNISLSPSAIIAIPKKSTETISYRQLLSVYHHGKRTPLHLTTMGRFNVLIQPEQIA